MYNDTKLVVGFCNNEIGGFMGLKIYWVDVEFNVIGNCFQRISERTLHISNIRQLFLRAHYITFCSRIFARV